MQASSADRHPLRPQPDRPPASGPCFCRALRRAPRARGRRALPAAHRRYRPEPLPAGIRDRHIRGSRLARPRLGDAAAPAIRTSRRVSQGPRHPRCPRLALSLLLQPPRDPGRDRRLRRRAPGAGGAALSRHLPRSARARYGRGASRRASPMRCASTAPRQARSRGRFPGRISIAARFRSSPGFSGDVVLGRRDAPASYHLAVTLDDHLQGVTLVTRGEDLLPATHVHRLLQALLGLDVPRWRHHRLLLNERGERLAKRDGAMTLAALRAAGCSAGDVRAMAGFEDPSPAPGGKEV